MKIFSFTLGLFCFSLGSIYAQPGQHQGNHKEAKQKIKALYTAFITQELNLNQDESAKFWAIHNEFDAEIKSSKNKNLSELDREEAILEIKKKYNKKFTTVIGTERADQFFKKDGEFRNKLMNKVKERKGESQQKNKGRKHEMEMTQE